MIDYQDTRSQTSFNKTQLKEAFPKKIYIRQTHITYLTELHESGTVQTDLSPSFAKSRNAVHSVIFFNYVVV